MPDFKVPQIKTPDLAKATNDLAGVAKDATYVVIGAGVLAVQKAQVQRQELQKRLGDPRTAATGRLQNARSEIDNAARTVEGRLKSARTDLSGAARSADARVEEFITRLEDALAPYEDRLPAQARDFAKQVHVQAKEVRARARERLQTAG